MKQRNTGPVITEESKLISIMIQLYYQKHLNDEIGKDEMLNYALDRLAFCRFGEKKTTCKKCPVHCYQKKYRQQMKVIMRYAYHACYTVTPFFLSNITIDNGHAHMN
ncbi:nitrous oxide-stimulated promoter family protein [Enterococcus cecorum]